MRTQPHGQIGPIGPPPLAASKHVEMTPELRQKYVMLLGQHTNATDQPPPKTKSEKQAVDVPLDELSPEFSFDDLNILGADSQGQVYLQGRYYVANDKDDPFKPCVIITTRRALKAALDCWLDDKTEYCESSGKRLGEGCLDFCGVMGSLQSLKYVELPEYERCELMPAHYEADADPDDGDKWEWKPVRTFYVASFEKDCNMQHGQLNRTM